MECVRLRVKDVDFGYARITVRDGKGAKDRLTMLPVNLAAPLDRHLIKVQAQHEQDLEEGFGEVHLPFALERKFPNARREWAWQYVFPSSRLSRDPRAECGGGTATEAASSYGGRNLASGAQESGTRIRDYKAGQLPQLKALLRHPFIGERL
jgi:integrase